MNKNIILLGLFFGIIFTTKAQPSDSYLLHLIDTSGIPGLSIVIVKDGHWIYERNIGYADIAAHTPVTRKTDFGMPSVSGCMVSVAALQLKERGLLSLDVDINRYLPFTYLDYYYPADTITLRMILNNTSDIRDNPPTIGTLAVNGDSPISLDSVVKNYFSPGGTYYSFFNFAMSPPGEPSPKSQMAIALAAYIIERVTGDKFNHYCDTAIFRKICMENTGYKLSDIYDSSIIARGYYSASDGLHGMPHAGVPYYPLNQLRSNITSVARFMDMYIHYGVRDGTRILDSSSVEEILHNYYTISSIDNGLGFIRRLFYHSSTFAWGNYNMANGYTATMFADMNNKTGIAILTSGYTLPQNLTNALDTLFAYAATVTPSSADVFPECEPSLETNPIAHGDVSLQSLYPNPSTGEFNLETPENGFAVLIDIQGQRKGRYELNRGANKIEVSHHLTAGLYIVAIYSREGLLLGNKKLIYLP